MTELPKAYFSAVDGNELTQAIYIPTQQPPPASNSPSMKAYISTFPSLGQVTQIDQNTSVFTALLEVDESRAQDAWKISLWHSEGTEWREVPMDPLRNSAAFPTALGSSSTITSSLHKLYFTTPLAIHLPTTFTIKFKNGSNQPWKWVKEHQGIDDGIVMLKTLTSKDTISSNLHDYIEGLNPIAKIANQQTQSPGTTLWTVELPIKAAKGEESNLVDIRFGLPWGFGKYSRWFALVRMWQPWICPRQGKTHFELDKDGLLLSFLSLTGKHLVLLALSGVDDIMTVFTSVDGNVNLRVRNDSDKDQFSRILVGLGDDFESANAAVIYAARDIVMSKKSASGELQKEIEALKTGDEATKLWQENWYDGLSYCTWNALGQRLNEGRVLEAVEALALNNINVTNFIIDDNWQSIDYRGGGQFQHGWVEFEAERNAFPNGLKHLVSKIREKQPSIQHVAVWHALLGYWGGISPGGKLATTYKTIQAVRDDDPRNLPLDGKITLIAKEDVGKFYDDFYRFLSSCGVDAVKTDAQFMLDTLVSAKDRRDLITAYQDAWSVSTLRHFSVKAISCMSQIPDILFHSQLPTNTPPILVRNSDDFLPEVPTSHPWHVWNNAHNALFTQHLNLLPDWDMFQTVHDYSGFHAAARCVSGGPIYITDVPNHHNLDLIREMTGTTPRGKTVIFRPSVIGKSLDVYNGYDDDALLLVGTYHGGASTGTGIVGFFNISQRPLTELVPLSKFPGVEEAQYYIVRAHSSGSVSPPIQVVDPKSLIYISLDVRGYDILSAYPLRGFVDEEKKETTWIANLGLLGKMAGAAAVVDTKMTRLENGRIVIDTNIKALGVLGIYISTLTKQSFKDTLLITILGKILPVNVVKVSKADKHVLEINIEKAWKDLKLDSGWSNEVEVKIYINPSH